MGDFSLMKIAIPLPGLIHLFITRLLCIMQIQDLELADLLFFYQTDVDYAVVWSSDMLCNNSILSETVMGLTDYVDDVMDNNNTDFECIIKYSENAVSEFGREDLLERDNIQKVVIAFVAADPKSVVIQNSVELFSNIRERIK